MLEVDPDRNVRVRHDVIDDEQTPPAIVSRREGWVDSSSVGSVVVRHHIHLRHHGGGAARWTQHADGHDFAPFWVPLIPQPETCASQLGWLAFAYEAVVLRASYAEAVARTRA